MTTTSTPTIAVAPTMGEQGSRKTGGHYNAYRATPVFAPTATLRLVSAVNPWRPMSPGHAFYTAVLANNPATVSDAIALGAKAGLKAREVQNHLRWLYTWGGAYLEVDGKLFAAPAPVVAPKAVAPKGKKSK